MIDECLCSPGVRVAARSLWKSMKVLTLDDWQLPGQAAMAHHVTRNCQLLSSTRSAISRIRVLHRLVADFLLNNLCISSEKCCAQPHGGGAKVMQMIAYSDLCQVHS